MFRPLLFLLLLFSLSLSLAHAKSLDCEKRLEGFDPSETKFADFMKWPKEGGFLSQVEKVCSSEKAKEVVISFLFEGSGLTKEERQILFLQASRLSHASGNQDDAVKYSNLARAKLSKPQVQWNLYLDAYGAYLKKDAEKMSEIRKRMLNGPSISGKTLYLSYVDDLLAKMKK